ncbi:Flp pilus assembly protein TadD [Dyella sp. C11]|uniref:Flp pilus assembly protein TadD n=1 Tax=Dyella sp. C11 TaxID=2126991 RepID=UPI000D647CC8|nr:Flp pilus assembly protein TadD [Dyella sp. C11]
MLARSSSARLVIALVGCLLLAACGKTLGGYPNRAPTPSLVAPGANARDDKTVYMDLIRQMQQQGAYYASLAHIDAYRQRFGDTPELRRRQADAFRATGQLDAARTIYRGLLNGDQAAAAWHGLGLVEAQSGNASAADVALLKASELEPVNAAYLSDLGYARLCNGETASAKDPLAMAAELDPTNAKMIANLALWAMLTGDNTRADAIMQRGQLPVETQNGVRQLAMQLAARRPRTAASSSQPTAAPMNVANTPANANTNVPASMLQRFTTDATAYEARP